MQFKNKCMQSNMYNCQHCVPCMHCSDTMALVNIVHKTRRALPQGKDCSDDESNGKATAPSTLSN